MQEIPTHSLDLINQLLDNEPEIVISPSMSMEEIMYKSGRRGLILELKYRYDALQKAEAEAEEVHKAFATIKRTDEYHNRS